MIGYILIATIAVYLSIFWAELRQSQQTAVKVGWMGNEWPLS